VIEQYMTASHRTQPDTKKLARSASAGANLQPTGSVWHVEGASGSLYFVYSRPRPKAYTVLCGEPPVRLFARLGSLTEPHSKSLTSSNKFDSCTFKSCSQFTYGFRPPAKFAISSFQSLYRWNRYRSLLCQIFLGPT
jgi:hypothetical protein